jgi:fatty-acid peroxygenase
MTFEIRLLGRRASVLVGREAVELFCDESKFQWRGAIPRPLRRTLFGDGAVHGLDEQHRHRKAVFLSLLTSELAVDIAQLAARRWDAAVADPARRLVLFDAAVEVHGGAACQWAGVPAEQVESGLARDLLTIVDGFGSVGPRHVRARLARKRADRLGRRADRRGSRRSDRGARGQRPNAGGTDNIVILCSTMRPHSARRLPRLRIHPPDCARW